MYKRRRRRRAWGGREGSTPLSTREPWDIYQENLENLEAKSFRAKGLIYCCGLNSKQIIEQISSLAEFGLCLAQNMFLLRSNQLPRNLCVLKRKILNFCQSNGFVGQNIACGAENSKPVPQMHVPVYRTRSYRGRMGGKGGGGREGRALILPQR
jgi:hypothetical protein